VSPRLGQAERGWAPASQCGPACSPQWPAAASALCPGDTWRPAGSRNRACRVSHGQLGGTQGQRGPWPLGTSSKIVVHPQGHIVQQFGVPRDIKLLSCVFMELMISVAGGAYISP